MLYDIQEIGGQSQTVCSLFLVRVFLIRDTSFLLGMPFFNHGGNLSLFIREVYYTMHVGGIIMDKVIRYNDLY